MLNQLTNRYRAKLVLILAIAFSLIVLAFIFTPAPQTSALIALPGLEPASEAQVNASLDGAVVGVMTGDVVCSADRISFTISDGSLSQTQMVLTTSSRSTPDSSFVYALGGSFAQLDVNLIDVNGEARRSFTATEGDLEIIEGKGMLSGTLHNEAGEQLFASAVWSCPR